MSGSATFSAGGGGTPAGDSRATFVQPSSPTQGLQGYRIEKPILRLYPGTSAPARFRQRTKRAARNHAGRALAMQKDGSSMKAQFAEMVSTLEKSVGDIVAAGGPDVATRLAKGFAEFHDAAIVVANDAATLVNREPLFKSLGNVGQVCTLVRDFDEHMEAIRESGDCSEEVAGLLEHAHAAADLAMRCAVNEHVEMAPEDFDPEDSDVEKGTFVCQLPLSKDATAILLTDIDPDGEHAELLKFVTAPGDIAERAVTLGCGMLVEAGIDEDALAKMFEDGDLAKFSPGAVPPGAAPAPGAADPASGGAPADDGADPITILGRLLAAAMIQCSHLQDLVSGTGTDPAVDGSGAVDGAATAGAPDPGAAGGGDPAGDPNQPAAPQPPAGSEKKPDEKPGEKKPNPFAKVDGEDELQKIADAKLEALVAERVEATLAPMRPQLEKMLRQPEPMRGYAGPGHLSKAADSGATIENDPLGDEALAKMSPDDKMLALTKRALRNPTQVDPRRAI